MSQERMEGTEPPPFFLLNPEELNHLYLLSPSLKDVLETEFGLGHRS